MIPPPFKSLPRPPRYQQIKLGKLANYYYSLTFTFAKCPIDNKIVNIFPLTYPAAIHPLLVKRRILHPDYYQVAITDPFLPEDIVYIQIQACGPVKECENFQFLLHQPEVQVSLTKRRSKVPGRWEWNFEWEGKLFIWTKSNLLSRNLECKFIVSKYDIPITICIYEHNNALKNRESRAPSMTLLDSNIDRIGLSDIKGLHLLVLASVCAFRDIFGDSDAVEGSAEQIKKESDKLRKEQTRWDEKKQREKLLQEQKIIKETRELQRLQRLEQEEYKRKQTRIDLETKRLQKLEELIN